VNRSGSKGRKRGGGRGVLFLFLGGKKQVLFWGAGKGGKKGNLPDFFLLVKGEEGGCFAIPFLVYDAERKKGQACSSLLSLGKEGKEMASGGGRQCFGVSAVERNGKKKRNRRWSRHSRPLHGRGGKGSSQPSSILLSRRILRFSRRGGEGGGEWISQPDRR